jgi:hypothetical protein
MEGHLVQMALHKFSTPYTRLSNGVSSEIPYELRLRHRATYCGNGASSVAIVKNQPSAMPEGSIGA